MDALSVVSLLAAGVPEDGGYFSVFKILLFLLLPLPWLYAAAWADHDIQRIHGNRLMWTSLVFGGGIVALLLWVLIPIYLVGLALFLIGVGALVALYVTHRNARVVPEARVMTREHIEGFLSRGKRTEKEVETRIKVYDASGSPVRPPTDGAEQDKIIFNLVQDLLYEVVWRRASEVDVAPQGNQVTAVRFVIDGVVTQRPTLETPDADAMIDYLKAVAGLDPNERRRPQQGSITVDLAGSPIDLDLTVAGTRSGQRLQIKIVQEAIRTRLGELGLAEDKLIRLRELNAETTGLMIVSGRSGNGVTSTLYSLLRDNDAYIKQLATVEQKVEVDLENITEHKYKDPAQMPRVLAGVLRRDPDVVMVDKVEDAAGAQAVIEGASEKKILLGMHANDSFTALAKWVKTVGSTSKAVEPLRAVLCQVLMRKLCPACKEAYRPDPEMLRKANLPAGKVDRFYRPPTKPLTDEKGNPYTCPTCQGSGYLGRTAAFELLEINPELRKLIAGGANLTQIKAAARKQGMLYLQEAALRLVIEGVTSVQEVIRVTRSSK